MVRSVREERGFPASERLPVQGRGSREEQSPSFCRLTTTSFIDEQEVCRSKFTWKWKRQNSNAQLLGGVPLSVSHCWLRNSTQRPKVWTSWEGLGKKEERGCCLPSPLSPSLPSLPLCLHLGKLLISLQTAHALCHGWGQLSSGYGRWRMGPALSETLDSG